MDQLSALAGEFLADVARDVRQRLQNREQIFTVLELGETLSQLLDEVVQLSLGKNDGEQTQTLRGLLADGFVLVVQEAADVINQLVLVDQLLVGLEDGSEPSEYLGDDLQALLSDVVTTAQARLQLRED